MVSLKTYDVVIVGGGIVGAATAMSLLQKKRLSLLLIEAESTFAAHQTGHNSGVIHSGLYYKPGSLKAQNCVWGREMMYRYCDENNISFERCGKLVTAVAREELPNLNMLEERGRANGLTGIKRLRAEEMQEVEPAVLGIEGLFVPETGIVDYTAVTQSYIKSIEQHGGETELNCRFSGYSERFGDKIIHTTKGDIKTKILVNCGGLYSDRIAKLCGLHPDIMIVPFRGEYYTLKEDKRNLIRNLIYPVPDPQFPFLGVHFTRMINGEREAGPNAVLAFKREGYYRSDFSFRDMSELTLSLGFWKMAMKYYSMGFREYYRSLSKKKFVESLQKLVPAIQFDDIIPGGSGVRAQALDRRGKLLDDFYIMDAPNMIHVLNAPSPAATASLSIGDHISSLIIKRLD